MHCMKCGRKIEDGQVFCAECLQFMEQYPVDPGVVIRIPKRRESAPARRNFNWRKTVTPEEQIRKLKKNQRKLIILWLVTLALLIGAMIPAVSYFLERDDFLPGQNYSLIDSLLPTE